MPLRRMIKKSLHLALVHVLKRLPTVLRVQVIRDGVSMSDMYNHLPRHLLVDLCLGGASRLPRIKSIVVEGSLGTYEAMARDRTILPSYVQTGTWSPELQTLLADKVFKGGRGTFIDIGSNIGLTCVPIAMKHHVNCFAFEPDPTNYKLLEGNIARNGVTQTIVTHNIALSDSDGELLLELSGDNLGDHRLRLGRQGCTIDAYDETHRQTIKVKTRRLDDVLDVSKLQRPVLVKIDVQGAELHVLRGSTGLLKDIDVLVMEFWPYGLERAGASLDELCDYFREFPLGAVLRFDGALGGQMDSCLELRSIESIISELNAGAPSGDPDFHIDIVLSRESGRKALSSRDGDLVLSSD